VAAVKATGVASDRAQGQATTSTETTMGTMREESTHAHSPMVITANPSTAMMKRLA